MSAPLLHHSDMKVPTLPSDIFPHALLQALSRGIFLLQKPKSAPPKSKSFTLPKAHPIRGFLMSAPLLHHSDIKLPHFQVIYPHGLYLGTIPWGILFLRHLYEIKKYREVKNFSVHQTLYSL